MFTIRSTAHRSWTRRFATGLATGLTMAGLLVGCGEAAVTETEVKVPSGRVTIDEELVKRELILFENRRAAWAKQYAESQDKGEDDDSADESPNVNQREHLPHKDMPPP